MPKAGLNKMSIMFLPLRLIPVPVQCVVLATVLEMLLGRDDKLQPLLEGLEGRSFRIHVSDTNVVVFLGFTAGRPWVRPVYNGDVDVRIEATTTGFARMCFAHEDPDALVMQQELKMSGDSETMLRFKHLFAATNLDWEQGLRSTFGDFFGSRVARAAHALIAAEKKLAEGSRQAVSSSLKGVCVPDAKRLEAWQTEVEHLWHQVSSLKGRTTKLEHRLAEYTSPSEDG